MLSLGTVPANTTIYIPFATYGGTNGESIICSGLAVTDIEIYKDGSVTQRASDSGYALLDTDGINFDNITGIHGFSIDLSDNTDAGFYAVGSWYWVVVSSITVDSQTVNFIAAVFRIGPAEAVTGYTKADVSHWLGTAAATPTVAGVPEVDVTHWIGTAAATPTVAGVPEVDVTHWIGTAAATPTVAGVPEVDVTHIAGAAVNTAAAQLGVNTVSVTNNAITAAAIATDAIDADALAADALTEIFNAIMKTDWTGISGEAARSALNALRFLRNKWSIAGVTLTVTKEDDSTAAWTSTLTTDAAAEPVTASDPAGP